MIVDSRQRSLNLSQVVLNWLQNNPHQKYPMQVMLPAILRELSMPNVKTRQMGNTVFEIIPGQNKTAFFKAFNADTADNFVRNSKGFVVWARNVLGLQTLVTEFDDPTLLKLFQIIASNPPMPHMGYKVNHLRSGNIRIVLNLGR